MTLKTKTYIAFLRGINVGGHHKLPMADLKVAFKQLAYRDIVTLLNSGNVIFNALEQDLKNIEKDIEVLLEKTFGFPVPTFVRKATQLQQLYESNPFENTTITKDIRLYVSFLKEDKSSHLTLPWISDDTSYQIIEKRDATVLSVLDVSISKTTTAMKVLENTFGKNMTTRNWKTIEHIIKKL
ncbi:DUF1697 domain-containing protein [uncultured Dokdonia sp.]|uniref:DUF1697 domain-containing protein n=1 Tax=uncultured Dokdonia sp. TaxID=575653 RepID=UPI0026155ECF|nr:DUF1697 domain-containing protein [uncultured Dokdonia sp.]